MSEKVTPTINHTVMVTDPAHYGVIELNKYSDANDQPDRDRAWLEHESFKMALEDAGITVKQVPSREGCQDAIYAANGGLCDDDLVITSNLPGPRRAEQDYWLDMFRSDLLLGEDKKTRVIQPPEEYRFSGQGDALICDDVLFVGSGYRNSPEMTPFLRSVFHDKYDVVGVHTVPMRDENGDIVRNQLSGWEDSEFYDIDLAIGVVAARKIIWCPEAFDQESREKIEDLDFEKIEISRDEATDTFVCNGVGNGVDKYIVGKPAPDHVVKRLKKWGVEVVSLTIPELQKGGGSTRCMANTIRMR